MKTIKQTRAKQGGVTRGNKEVGQGEHVADTNKDRTMCLDTKQTEKRGTETRWTGLSGQDPDSTLPLMDAPRRPDWAKQYREVPTGGVGWEQSLELQGSQEP